MSSIEQSKYYNEHKIHEEIRNKKINFLRQKDHNNTCSDFPYNKADQHLNRNERRHNFSFSNNNECINKSANNLNNEYNNDYLPVDFNQKNDKSFNYKYNFFNKNNSSINANKDDQIYKSSNIPFDIQNILLKYKDNNNVYNPHHKNPEHFSQPDVRLIRNKSQKDRSLVLDSKSEEEEREENNLTNTMQKDRILFEYSKSLKDLKHENSELQKAFQQREDKLSKLIEDNKTLHFNLNYVQETLKAKEDEIKQLNQTFIEKAQNQHKEKVSLEHKISEISIANEKFSLENMNLSLSNTKLQKEVAELNKKLKTKDDYITKLEKQIEEMKKEVFTIPNLSKKIKELENTNYELSCDLKHYKELNNKFLKKDNEVITINKYSREDKELEEAFDKNEFITNNHKLLYENDSIKKILCEKTEECEMINKKYKDLFLENESFVKYITSEIMEFNYFVDNFQSFNSKQSNDKTLYLKNSISPYIPVESKYLSLQYEIIQKNFELMKNNLLSNYEENYQIYERAYKKNSENENRFKEAQAEKNEATLKNNIYMQKIKELEESNLVIKQENLVLTESMKNLQSYDMMLKTENENIKILLENYKREKGNIVFNLREKIKFLNNKFEIFYAFDKSENNVEGSKNRLKSLQTDENQEQLLMHAEKSSFENLTKQDNISEINITESNIDANNVNLKLDFVGKIYNFIDWLILEYTNIFMVNKTLNDNNTQFLNKIKTLQDEKIMLDSRIDRIIISKEEELRNLELKNQEELQKLEQTLLLQIDNVITKYFLFIFIYYFDSIKYLRLQK